MNQRQKMLMSQRCKLMDITIYKFQESGLVINTEYTFLGASPDGLVHDPVSADANGLLEIKCPYQLKDISPYEAAQQKSFFLLFTRW